MFGNTNIIMNNEYLPFDAHFKYLRYLFLNNSKITKLISTEIM